MEKSVRTVLPTATPLVGCGLGSRSFHSDNGLYLDIVSGVEGKTEDTGGSIGSFCF